MAKAKKTDNTAEIGFEEQIWKAADKLRGNLDASEYKNVVLGLIFLKYISDKFEQRYQELVEEGEGFEEDRDEYTYQNIFFVPQEARWETIAAAAHTPEIGKVIDNAMRMIESENDYLAQLCEVVVGKYCESGTDCLGDICYQVTDKANCEDADLDTYVSTESLLQNKRGRQQATSLPATGKVTRYATGDTLVSNIRPYFKKVWYAPFDGTCSGDVLVFRANSIEYAPYLHACLRQDRFFDHVMRGAKGTKMPRGDKKQMMEFNVSATCRSEDLSLLNVALSQIAANDAESTGLGELRATLLPKLMSGEIDVSKVKLPMQLNNHLSAILPSTRFS